MEIDPNNANAWYNKGLALDNLGNRQEAIEYYDKAIGIDPKYVMAWNKIGRVLGNLGKNQEAYRIL